ncbi:MAG: AAA family ATPase [Thermodesulfobacteriota bacterium]
MKILELRFKNLNSLYGHWRLDFSAPEFAANGIFAITGPTGAGKSTILDAICLALYGRTPRLNRVNKSGNEIMSRQTGECYAEVTFASQAGNFRCHWSQHRARKKADGDLQPPKHEIVAADSGQVLEVKLLEVAKRVAAVTGMDFERFTRSILLAQGGFDTFLKANTDERAPILEQITGTEIYSEISRRVHERQRLEGEKLKALEAEMAGIEVLDPDRERETVQELVERQRQEKGLVGQTDEMAKGIAWLSGIAGLKKEISSLAGESEKLQGEIAAFKADRQRLSRALKAAELDGVHGRLTEVRKGQAADHSALKSEEDKLPVLAGSCQELEKARHAGEEQSRAAKEERQQTAPIIQKVRLLDQKLTEQKKAVVEGEGSCRKYGAEIAADRLRQGEEEKKRAGARNDLLLVERYLEENSRDEWLVSGLAGAREQLANLSAKEREIVQKGDEEEKAKAALKGSGEKLAACRKRCGVRGEELAAALNTLAEGKEGLNRLLAGRLLREYRREKETLLREKMFLDKIASLEEQRARLEEGKPCPLCGSEEHPFVQGHPGPDKIEKKLGELSCLIGKAEDQEAAIKDLETAAGQARENLVASEKLEAAALAENKVAEERVATLVSSLAAARAGFAELQNAVLAKLAPLGIGEWESDPSALLESLEARLARWQAQVKKKAAVEKQLIGLDGELQRLAALIETRSRDLAGKEEALSAVRKEYALGIDQRQVLFGDKKTADEELRLDRAISAAELAEKEARGQHEEARQRWNSSMTNVASLQERLEQRGAELKKMEADFSASLPPAGFVDEKQFRATRLPVAARDSLAAKARELDDGQTALAARQSDRENRLAAELAKKVTLKGLGELEPQLRDLGEELKTLRAAIAGLQHKLAEHAVAQERLKEKWLVVESQKKEWGRWEKLHGLIGSADGKRYRNFAQGLTFELMISHANRQLAEMTDRYLLIRDEVLPLELNVVDNYQAGEIRSTKNLSGGESFIVSLSLALGLSKMASHKVRVDSLFLDEGFGTLDADALETALETLGGLQQDGKLIGVISHVSALKERIATQINIVPISGGRSSLVGPGCEAIPMV